MRLDGRKKYYSTSEVAEILGVQDHVLRHWENEFTQVKPRKSRNGQRRFVKADIELLQKIQYLMHKERFSSEGAKQRLELMRDISLERYISLSQLVFDLSFWDELQQISDLL